MYPARAAKSEARRFGQATRRLRGLAHLPTHPDLAHRDEIGGNRTAAPSARHAISVAALTLALSFSMLAIVDLGAGRASAVNDSGQIAGDYLGGNYAFLYSGGSSIDLGSLGGFNSKAYAINGTGTVVGGSFLQTDEPHGI